jgi:type II secretory pathway pseudopilin PulG
MIWKRYQNELMVVAALLFALLAYSYKSSQRTAMAEANQQMAKEVALFQETVSLKKIWGDKRIASRLESIRKLIPAAKVKWQKKGRKLTVNFSDLKASEVNTVVTKFLNIPVQLEAMKVQKRGDNYTMEIRCKW